MRSVYANMLMMIFLATTSVLCAQDIQHLKDNHPITLHGHFSAGLNYYNNFSEDKEDESNTSFGNSPSYFLQASPVLSLYGYSIPVNFMIASQHKSFDTPFSRFGLSPYYKWAKLHLGWRSLNFSQFTLNGQQMLGAGFELTPGKFRVAFMCGKFNKAITDISLYNNLNNNTPLYKRKGFAAKIGYGSAANFIEFSYLQAKDDSSSIPDLEKVRLKPAANQVAGLKGQLTMLKVLSFSVDAAASYYTRDISSSLLEIDNRWTRWAAFAPRTSSRIAFAGEAKIHYRFNKGGINLKYRRVEPDYKSMGAFYMQTDIEQYTVGFQYAFFSNKLHLQSDFGWQHNNLAKTAIRDSKRTIGNVTAVITLSPSFGLDIRYSNYGISQQIIPQLTDPTTILRYDSVRISQVNQTLSVSPHLFINKENVQHAIRLQASLQKLHNNHTKQRDNDFTSSMSSLIYSLIFPKSKINISNTLNYFNTVVMGNKTATLGYNLGISKSLASSKEDQKSLIKSVTLALYGGYFANSFNDSSTGKTISLNPSIGIVFLGKHSLNLTTNYTKTKNNQAGATLSRQQVMLSVRYSVAF